MARADDKPSTDDDPDTPLLEWIAGAIGLALFVGVIGFTLVNGLSQGSPPQIGVRTGEIAGEGGLYIVNFDVTNVGDETAAAVRVSATLSVGGRIAEIHEIEIDFLPPHSRRQAAVIFARNPAEGVIDLVPESYRLP